MITVILTINSKCVIKMTKATKGLKRDFVLLVQFKVIISRKYCYYSFNIIAYLKFKAFNAK